MIRSSGALAAGLILPMLITAAWGASKDLGRGFRDHGVAAPISNHRGAVATVDGEGANVLLAWLMDHRGGYELLMVDAQNGKTEEFPLPFKNTSADSPYASILSSGNRFYTHFDSHFVEFSPKLRRFTYKAKTTPKMAMGMTEDDNGVIWLVSYPQSGLVSFDPRTRKLRDYGSVYKQNWPQYQRFIAADDAGWIYFAVGSTASQIVAFDPAAAKATPILSEGERKRGTAYVYRDEDGKVYGQALHAPGDEWYELYKGQAKKIGKRAKPQPKPIITSNQGLFHASFPDGSRVKSFNLVDRQLVVENKDKQVRELAFDYTSDGAMIMGLATASGGTIAGGTAFPMRFFNYDPKSDALINRPAYGQWNTVARHEDRFFVGGYGGGFLLEWDPAKPWMNTVKGKPGNPLYLTECTPDIHRPAALLPTADGKTVILAGTPQYGYTGGGLLFWDRPGGKGELLDHTRIIPDHSTAALVALTGGKILGGTTTSAGTGGEKKATVAELYIMDLGSKQIEWREAVFPGVQTYIQLCPAPNGLVYGIADRKIFFVFDPAKRAVIHQEDVSARFGPTAYQQGPRIFIQDPSGATYLLFTSGIASIDPEAHRLKMIAKSPVPIEGGGDVLDGRIYFFGKSHIYSYELSPAAAQ